MSAHNDEKDVTRKMAQHQSKIKREVSEAINDLEENVVGLVQHAKDVGSDKAHQVAEYVQERTDDLRVSGADALARVEDRIRARPGQSVGLAFAAGAILSFLLSRRS